MKFILACAAVALTATVAYAQPTTSYPFKVCVQGQPCTTPISSYLIPAAEVQCGQPRIPPPTGTVANGRWVRWNDPANSALDCVWDSGATSGPLWSLPFSTTIIYESIIQAVNIVGTGPESARSNPFNRPGAAPAVLTGLRVTP